MKRDGVARSFKLASGGYGREKLGIERMLLCIHVIAKVMLMSYALMQWRRNCTARERGVDRLWDEMHSEGTAEKVRDVSEVIAFSRLGEEVVTLRGWSRGAIASGR